MPMPMRRQRLARSSRASARQTGLDVTSGHSWAASAVERTEASLRPLANADEAGPMQAYMKNVAPFLGIKAPARRVAQRAAWAPLGDPSEGALATAVRRLWQLPEREFQYAAIELAGKHIRACGMSFINDPVEELITDKSWWDTIDGFAGAVVGPLVKAHPELVEEIELWSESGNRWLIRSAIIHQLRRKDTTDVELLFRLCRRHADDTEFFVAKAIGWALRQYAHVDPDAVLRFVAATQLQPLSRREATRNIV
jgi:3-methyladenine DNA glycosylase AlkD